MKNKPENVIYTIDPALDDARKYFESPKPACNQYSDYPLTPKHVQRQLFEEIIFVKVAGGVPGTYLLDHIPTASQLKLIPKDARVIIRDDGSTSIEIFEKPDVRN